METLLQKVNNTLFETLMYTPLNVAEETCLEEIAKLMMEKGDDHIFVVNKTGEPVGVVSGIDVVRKIMELLIG